MKLQELLGPPDAGSLGRKFTAIRAASGSLATARAELYDLERMLDRTNNNGPLPSPMALALGLDNVIETIMYAQKILGNAGVI